MTSKPTSSQELAAGLGTDRMHPPEFEAFFGGLARRVITLALRALPDTPRGDDPESTTSPLPADHSPEGNDDTKRGIDPTDELVAIGDAIDGLIDRTKAVGFPIDPNAATEDTTEDSGVAELEQRSPEIAALIDRIDAGATEVTRRLAGLSSAAWGTNPGLIDQVRATIVEVVVPIRDLERRIEHRTDR